MQSDVLREDEREVTWEGVAVEMNKVRNCMEKKCVVVCWTMGGLMGEMSGRRR